MISVKRSIIDEPKSLVTGVEGAGKTLFAVQQADLLARATGGDVYQLNIREADPVHLPKLPFAISDMAYDAAGAPVIDSETGDHLPRWATLPPGSVVIIDEAHKVFPQRGPGRPPKWVEMLGEGRQFGIRFVLLSQAPGSIDAFVRDRISRHYHLERKGGMQRATILEFDHCVTFPSTAWQERKEAQVHFWAYPTEYFGWYKSAKVHTFRRKIPFKVLAAVLFVPVAGYLAWKMYGLVQKGPFSSSPISAVAKPAHDAPQDRRERRPSSALEFAQRWQPLLATHPWSAPGFGDLKPAAQPEVYCASSGAGYDAQGDYAEASCRCITEQGTRYIVTPQECRDIVVAGGVYNPFREPSSARDHDKPGEPDARAPGVRDRAGVWSGGDTSASGQMSTYGAFRPGLPATDPVQASGV